VGSRREKRNRGGRIKGEQGEGEAELLRIGGRILHSDEKSTELAGFFFAWYVLTPI
jgi:hypothetical protein